MNLFSEHPFERESAGPDPLPLEFEFQSHRIDEAIARVAQRDQQSIPSGLSDRVFNASAGLLPRRQVEPMTVTHARMNVSSFRLMFAHMNLGRVAMAAMVLLAFGIGALMMHSSGVKSSDRSMVARNGERGDVVRSTAATSGDSATHVADWEIAAVAMNTAPGSVDEVNDKVDYLLEADTLTTPEEVRYDMAQLLASLE